MAGKERAPLWAILLVLSIVTIVGEFVAFRVSAGTYALVVPAVVVAAGLAYLAARATPGPARAPEEAFDDPVEEADRVAAGTATDSPTPPAEGPPATSALPPPPAPK